MKRRQLPAPGFQVFGLADSACLTRLPGLAGLRRLPFGTGLVLSCFRFCSGSKGK